MQKQSASSEVRPAALFLAPEAPYPTFSGGALRSASLLEYLSRHYLVDVIVFREPGAPDPRGAFPPNLARQVLVIDLPYHSKGLLARAARNAGRLARAVPPLNDRFCGFAEPVSRFLGGRRYELSVVEHFWCASYWEQLAPHSKTTLLNLHNIESVLYKRCAEVESWPIRYALRRFHTACLDLEQRLLPRFSFLLVPSEQDASRVREIAPESRVCVYPNAIPHVAEPKKTEEDVIIFSGNLGYLPNASAVRFFRKQIWPQIRDRWPGLTWRLVGKNPEAVRKYLDRDPRIHLQGPVDDAIEALAVAKVAVVPVLAGSGTRTKILEAWAAGRPVVSTSVGAEGLPVRHGEHLLLADDPGSFAEEVSALLASSDLRNKVGKAGRALYEEAFTWQSAWVKLAQAGI